MSMDELVSATVGLMLGGIVMLLWTALARWLGDERFWPLFREIASDLAAGASPEQFFRKYTQLLKLLASYVGKTTCRIGIAILPVVVAFGLLAPLVSRRAMEAAEYLTIHPPHSAVVKIGTGSFAVGRDGRIELPREERDQPVSLAGPDAAVRLPRLEGAIAIANSPWTCLGLQLLGLDTLYLADGPSLLILRPYMGDDNPLYPYLSDLEFWFWSGLVAGSLAGGFVVPTLRMTRWKG